MSKLLPKERKNYYILLINLTVDSRQDKQHLAGSLWEEANSFSDNVILVRKYEGEDIGDVLETNVDNLKQIKYDEAHILLAVPEPISQRLNITNNKDWLEEGLKIIVGSVVEVYDVIGVPRGALATVRFKGRLPGRNGTYYGVELFPEHAGKGSTNGTYRRKRLFSCDEDCGIFLSLLRIRFYYARSHDSGARPKTRTPGEGASVNTETKNPAAAAVETDQDFSETVLEIGERVVWISDAGPEYGTVKWQGRLPYSYNDKFIVGVEFDRPVGTGTGKYKGEQLFKAKRNHASLLPILGLMKCSDYDKMFNAGDVSNETKSKEREISDAMNRKLLLSESQREKSTGFAVGSVSKAPSNRHTDPHRWPQEHKETDSGLDVTEASDMVTRPRRLNGIAQNSSAMDRAKDSSTQFQMDSRSAVPRSKRQANFASSGTRTSQDSYVPPLLLDSEGKYENTANLSFRSGTLHEPTRPKKVLQIGDRVSISLGQNMEYGRIRWIGHIPESNNPTRVFAGLEMEADNKIFTGGTWRGRKIFDCPERRGFFFDLEKCNDVGPR